MRRVGHRSTHRRGEESVQGFDGKAKKKRPLGRQRRRWEDGIRIDLRKIVSESIEWIQLAQNLGRWWAVVNTG
jgi:hypothetical protein